MFIMFLMELDGFGIDTSESQPTLPRFSYRTTVNEHSAVFFLKENLSGLVDLSSHYALRVEQNPTSHKNTLFLGGGFNHA